jgi:hypothetical protein
VTRPGRGGDLETAGAGGAVEQGKKERGRLADGPLRSVGPTC